MKAIIEFSVSQASKACNVINYTHSIKDRLIQTSSNVWETEEYEWEDDEERDAHDELIDSVTFLLENAGVTEYDIDERATEIDY